MCAYKCHVDYDTFSYRTCSCVGEFTVLAKGLYLIHHNVGTSVCTCAYMCAVHYYTMWVYSLVAGDTVM